MNLPTDLVKSSTVLDFLLVAEAEGKIVSQQLPMISVVYLLEERCVDNYKKRILPNNDILVAAKPSPLQVPSTGTKTTADILNLCFFSLLSRAPVVQRVRVVSYRPSLRAQQHVSKRSIIRTMV